MPNTSDLNPDQTYDSFDVEAAASEIGSDLFPKSSESGIPDNLDSSAQPGKAAATDTAPAPGQEAAASPASVNIVPGQNSANPNPNQSNTTIAPLPKSWKKDMQAHWEKADPAIHAYVAEREAQVMRGIQMYQAGFNNWDATIKPFLPVLQNFPDVNPIQLIHGLLQTHLTFVNPNTPAEQKTQLVQLLLSEYGIQLDPNAAKPDAALMARLARAEQRLSSIDAERTARSAREANESYNSNLSAVTTFSADPKNKFYPDVENDILRILQNGQAKTLADAYEIAIWTNPVVRAKLIAEQQAPAKPATAQPRKADGTFINLDSAEPRTPKPKTGSIENTIDGIVSKHFPTHH
jgi:hypothetical protein